MAKSKRSSGPDKHIYWRKSEQSFLPPIDDEEIGELLHHELSRHVTAVQNKMVVNSREYYEEHVNQVRRDDGNVYFETKPESKGIMVDYESLKLTSEFLRALLGVWIPAGFVYSQLWFFRGNKPAKELALSPSQIGDAVESLLVALHNLRSDVDEKLKKQHGSSCEDELYSNRATEHLSHLFRNMAVETAKLEGAEDRWFTTVCSDVELFCKSLGCEMTEDEVDRIADRHFHSWCAPEKNASIQFADELAVEVVRRLFEDNYG